MFLTPVILIALLGLGVIACACGKICDSFHPIILAVPMFIFLYVCLPLKPLYGHPEDFLIDKEFENVQFINLLGLLSYCLGCFKKSSWRHYGQLAIDGSLGD
jgi:hypothetical protein